MDLLALILTLAALLMFLFATTGRELRRFNEISLGLVFAIGGADLPVHRDHEHSHRALTLTGGAG